MLEELPSSIVQFRSLIPPALVPAARAVYHRWFRFQLGLRCWVADLAPPRDSTGSPLPPALLRYRVCESLDRAEFLRIGEGCACLIEQNLSQVGANLADVRRVLDFGCGCGRTLRWMLPNFPGVEFHGADIDADAVHWCQENLAGAHLIQSTPQPPLPYSAGHFDIIYCLSVFTHLDEAVQDGWIQELSRLLASDGTLLMTVHGSGAATALDRSGLESLRATGFVHRRSLKLKGIVPDGYHTAWHSEQYIRTRLASHFDTVLYRDIPDGMQAFVMARRPRYFPRKDFTSTVLPV